MSLIHFFITKKNENSVVKELNSKLEMVKKSNRPSKVYLSTLDMKTAIIHNKNHVYDCVDMHKFGKLVFSLKSKERKKFYTSKPIAKTNEPSSFQANTDYELKWEHFNLHKTKNIMLTPEVINILQKISE